MLERVIGVLRLNVATYEEIEHDPSAMSQAAIVVAVVAIVGGLVAGGITAALGSGSFLGTFLQTLISAFVGWFVWSFATWLIGTKVFGGQADMGEMLRVLGFAQAPGILAIIPVCGAFIGGIWSLVCAFIAIRQGLDLDNGKAALTAVVAFVAVLIVGVVISLILGAMGLAVSGSGIPGLG